MNNLPSPEDLEAAVRSDAECEHEFVSHCGTDDCPARVCLSCLTCEEDA